MYIMLNVLILLISIASSSKGLLEGTDRLGTNSPSSSKGLKESTDQVDIITTSSIGLNERIDQAETSTSKNEFDESTDDYDYERTNPDPLRYVPSTCNYYGKVKYMSEALKTEKEKKVEHEEFTERLLSLIRYDKNFLQVFEPFNLSDTLPNKENLSCFETLHGLSNMRKIQQNVSYNSHNVVEIDVDFQYPKLCVKCSNLMELDFQKPVSERLLDRILTEGQYIHVCARYVKGKMDILRSIEKGHSEVHHIQINDIRFQLDFAGNTKGVVKPAKPVWETLKNMLIPLGKVVSEFLNSENHTMNLRTSIADTYKRAGNCSLGDCIILEGITDFELVDRINASLAKSASALDPKILNLTVPLLGDGDAKMFFSDLKGLSKREVVGYNKVKVPEKRNYRLEVIVRYPLLCLSGELRKYTNQVLDLTMCSKNFQVNMNIYFIEGSFRLGFEDMHWESPKFIEWNVTRIPFTYEQFRYHLVKFYDCHLFYFIYENVLMTVQSVLLGFRHCNLGTCFKESWDEDEASVSHTVANFKYLTQYDVLVRV